MSSRLEAVKELAKCAMQGCQSQMNAARSLFKTELDACLKKCNASGNKANFFDEAEFESLRGCFRTNNCKLPLEHLKQNRDAAQVKALRQCLVQRCAKEATRAKSLGVSGSN